VEPAAEREREPVAPPAVAHHRARSKSQEEALPPGGLVIYDRGKVIYRDQPGEAAVNSPTSPAEEEPAPSALGPGHPVELSPATARESLLASVEPDYPPEARNRHIQGPVVLKIAVTSEGKVSEASVVRGDPLLASAAVDAVKQWRFKAYAPAGEPIPWQTRVTVNFVLP
jgi:TonB family protein